MSKIVMVGGGSVSWGPNIVKDMLMTDCLRNAQYVLYDIDRQAADLVTAVLEQVKETLGCQATITSTDDCAAAFSDADYFVITISTGGLGSMAHDLAIPEEFGIYHTVGDTSGPGGWARLMRNFWPVKTLAEGINRYAPCAMVLNYTNPMTTLTKVLSSICSGPVVGLCHGLFENLAFLQRFYDLESEDDISVSYAGLNHFFWITEMHARGRDLLDDLRQRLEHQTFTDLLRESDPDPMGFKSSRELATELFRLTQVMPYLGDRHTCEFFGSYITNRAAMSKYKLVRTSVEEREQGFQRRQATLRQWAQEGIPDDFATRSRETAADIIAAHVQGRPFIDVGNLPNEGQIANLPRGTIVETAVRVDQNGFSPLAFGRLPPFVKGLVEPYTTLFDLGVEACFAGDKQAALQALRLDPVCSHLNAEEVNDLGSRLLKAHRPYIPMFDI